MSFGWLVIKNKHLEDVTLGSGSHFPHLLTFEKPRVHLGNKGQINS